MTDPHPELTAAARLLVQWGQTRQAAWRDPSSDLLEALGDRYAAFTEMAVDAPPPPPFRPIAPQPPPLPAVPAPLPLAPSPPAPAAPVMTTVFSAVTAPVPVKARDQAPRHTSVTRRRFRLGRIALAAGVILAVAATPRLWLAYGIHAPAAPTTNAVTIETNPPGSTVVIDGVDSGTTPLTTALAIGRHTVELRHRKSVRTMELDVTADGPVVARVDWVKKPAPKKPTPRRRAPAPAPAATESGPSSTPPVQPVEPPVSSSSSAIDAATAEPAAPAAPPPPPEL